MPGMGRLPAARSMARSTTSGRARSSEPESASGLPSPRIRSCGRSAAITNAISSSSGTPSSAAPGSHVLAAYSAGEGLVLELLLDARDLEVRQAAGWPDQRAGHQESDSSSTAKRALASGVVRGTPVYAACPRIACCDSAASPRSASMRTPSAGMLPVGRMIGVGKAFVVEIMHQTHDAPDVRVGPLARRHGAHGDLDRVHVLPQRIGGRVFVDEGECGFAVHITPVRASADGRSARLPNGSYEPRPRTQGIGAPTASDPSEPASTLGWWYGRPPEKLKVWQEARGARKGDLPSDAALSAGRKVWPDHAMPACGRLHHVEYCGRMRPGMATGRCRDFWGSLRVGVRGRILISTAST